MKIETAEKAIAHARNVITVEGPISRRNVANQMIDQVPGLDRVEDALAILEKMVSEGLVTADENFLEPNS